MSLSDSERAVLSSAGTTPAPVLRRQAVAIALRKSGTDLTDARDLLATGFVAATQGRTYSLATLHHLLDIPDIDSLRGTAS